MNRVEMLRRALLCCVFLLSCGSVTPVIAGETRVALPGNVFARLADNRPAGVFVEAFDAVMRESGIVPTYITMSADVGVRALAKGQVSAVAVVVPNEKLANDAWFSEPVLTEYNVILTHRGKGFAVNRISDLYGRRIAGRTGYSYPLLDSDKKIRLTAYRTNGEMIRAMLLGREDLAIISGVSDVFTFRAEGIMSRLEIIDTAVGSVPLVMAFSKKDFAEADVVAFNQRMAAFKQSPQWQQLLGRSGMSDLVREWPVLGR